MANVINKKIKANNRHWKNFLDKDYLGSHNLEPGEEMLLTIAKFEGEEMVQTAEGKSAKPVLYFKEKDAPKMILNVTNGTTVASLYGSHPDGWVDKQILVYAASVKAFGKMQDALRIRDRVPKIAVDTDSWGSKLRLAKTLDELKAVWESMPRSAQVDQNLKEIKEEIKNNLLALV